MTEIQNDKASILTEHIEVEGVRLESKFYEGNKEYPTLVFLHEGLGCVDMWRDFPEEVSRVTGCPALIYSRQGYGRSDPCPLERPLRYMHHEALDVLPKLLEGAGIKDHILIGHSDGGSIALIYAGGAIRKGLKGIVTMAAHIFCEQLSVDSIKEAKEAFEKGKLRPALQKYHFENVDCAFIGWNNAWLDPEFMQWNIEEYLPNIDVPQLVIQGKDDQYGTVDQVEGIEQKSGGSVDVVMLSDCGHSPYKEQFQRSLSEVKAFIDGLLNCD